MKIAWVTPLAVNSAIARVSVIVCEALAERGHHVDIVRAEAREAVASEHLPTSLRVTTSFDLAFSEAVESYDAIFINVGDNFNFHGGIFEYLRKPVAIGIFHDFYLIDLFHGWRHAHGLTQMQAAREIVSVYGPDATDHAIRATSDRMSMAEIAARVPMCEWIAMKCAGAIAHSAFYVPRLRESCGGVVEVANLPWPGRDVPPPPAESDKFTIITVGWLNPNKCVDVVIDAIGQSDLLREKARYLALGPVQDTVRYSLEAKAREKGVDFVAPGSVSDEQLISGLAQSDVICCLRKPVLEGASASAIEGMLAARPVIVADTGFYADLPDDCVVKVPASVRPGDVTAVLEKLATDSAARREIGMRARAWIQTEFSLDAYVAKIENVARQQIRLGPYQALSDRVAWRLDRLRIDAGNAAVGRLAGVIDGMRQPNIRSPDRI